ncbi:MAG: hypothetical protein HZB92_01390 [Euryarchaeota archaeon]|nr:hypothetical protein [Euryarchaeota archaeon]
MKNAYLFIKKYYSDSAVVKGDYKMQEKTLKPDINEYDTRRFIIQMKRIWMKWMVTFDFISIDDNNTLIKITASFPPVTILLPYWPTVYGISEAVFQDVESQCRTQEALYRKNLVG